MSTTTETLAHPLKYLDQAMNKLRDLGLMPEPGTAEEAPVVALINKIADLDEDKSLAIARTLNQSSVFNEVVREQLQAMDIGERYEDIAKSFNSIRDDAKSMLDQLEDGSIDIWERVQNVWMKVSRGDIPERFNDIKQTYLEVTESSHDQIQREQLILEAYRDFRGALKEAEVLSFNLLNRAEGALDQAKENLKEAAEKVAANTSEDKEEIARLELRRDERIRELQNADERYQIAKDISDNLTVSYNTTETVMARLAQTTNLKERVYSQAVAFFGTNEIVLTALSASYTGMFGLHESTQTLKTMKEGMSRSLEDLAEIGGKVQEAAIREGYGPGLRADAVRKLVESVVQFQERSVVLIAEMRDSATKNAEEVRSSVEDGKRRLAALAAQGNAIS